MGQDAVKVRQADFDRKNELAARGSGTNVDRDTSMAALIQAKQILEFVRNQQATTMVKLGGSLDASIDDFPEYIQAKAGVEEAERNLRNTKVLAPIDGVATQVAQIELGRVAPAGQPVFAVVADKGLWVDANPKESDMTYVRAGTAGDGDGRRVPGPGLERDDLLDRAGHGRAVLDPAAAERERQLGQGRPAGAFALLLRPGRGHEQCARRHERLSLDRHRPRAHAQGRSLRPGRFRGGTWRIALAPPRLR